MNDREGPQATEFYSRNWLILFAALLLLTITGFLIQFVFGSGFAAAITSAGLAAIAMAALIDGGWRLFGNEGFLGPGEGIDRLLAAFQVLLALAGLFGLIGG